MAPGDHVFLTGRDPARVETQARRLTGTGAPVHPRVVDVTGNSSSSAVLPWDGVAATPEVVSPN